MATDKQENSKEFSSLEAAIARAVAAGVLVDKRVEMPRGRSKSGRILEWPRRKPEQILGQCVHQNAGVDNDPTATARYHTSPHNHITPGRPMPSICYAICIPNLPGPAWLTADPLWRTYAQNARDDDGFPGDENTHLLAVLVMGKFNGPGYRTGSVIGTIGPTKAQMNSYRAVTQWAMRTFGYGPEGIFGHYMFGKIGCPGYALMYEVEAARLDAVKLKTDCDWQQAMLRWLPGCLPKFGADGKWGSESKMALLAFQKAHGLRPTAVQDPFTELVLLKHYPLAEKP